MSNGALDERGHRIGEMLQDLMGVDDVDAAIVDLEGIGVTDREVDVDAALGRGSAGRFDDVGRRVDAAHATRCDQRGQIDRESARTATDVEHVEPRAEMWDEVRGGVLRCAPSMRSRVMAVRVGLLGHRHSISDCRPGGKRI